MLDFRRELSIPANVPEKHIPNVQRAIYQLRAKGANRLSISWIGTSGYYTLYGADVEAKILLHSSDEPEYIAWTTARFSTSEGTGFLPLSKLDLLLEELDEMYETAQYAAAELQLDLARYGFGVISLIEKSLRCTMDHGAMISIGKSTEPSDGLTLMPGFTNSGTASLGIKFQNVDGQYIDETIVPVLRHRMKNPNRDLELLDAIEKWAVSYRPAKVFLAGVLSLEKQND